MKLILANNQSDTFKGFYDDLSAKSDTPFEYSGYDSLLFCFNESEDKPVKLINLLANKEIDQYDGVYINGYTSTYELAATVAVVCESLNISFVNKELSNPPSMSKLSMYAKLASSNVSIPKSYGGTKNALLMASDYLSQNMSFPAILKRADADRGIDNFKVAGLDEVHELLNDQTKRSLWILQDYIGNDGFYLVSIYDNKPIFSIYRTLEDRPDKNAQKAHMYKPKGGANATLLKVDEIPELLKSESVKAATAMNRQIASVDSIYDESTNIVYVLEVNYNPQLVTIETYKDVRIEAFLNNLNNIT
jgi:glutathione synthase/RimK-type ligase-like ATP-grasp enzyme